MLKIWTIVQRDAGMPASRILLGRPYFMSWVKALGRFMVSVYTLP